MKHFKFITAVTFAFAMLFSFQMNAQDFKDLDKSPMDAAAYPSSYKESEKLVKITYSRPQLKGRSVDDLAPENKVWRVGANEAAEITFYKDVKLGDTVIKAGTYSFFVIPEASEWTAIISTDLNVWGSYSYKKENDVARLVIPVTKGKKSLEAFSIAFDKNDNGVNMHLGWGTVRVAVPFTI
ncbi:DUF2911 domain-containing protein [uncultured Winogradskyella sp.]|uniref:DUF2911 domain-containing protein n=1 Tax=uncultured Winogradskyella sp. TaxID=395353 RepID=UPI0026244931|nr:DUF2911 domain-containing protein [uncultured Winogradskyella sp.]|tara:strand:- start:1272 stop:1817 length:546 start_codon:yes stop_codon:yes gene_type:complete